MSVLFSGRKFSTSKRPSLKCSDIAGRDMTKKQKVHRKVKHLPEDGKVQLTNAWNIIAAGQQYRVSFSRDNLHVWINGKAVETDPYISDKGYDVDLFFSLGECQGHIYSDVEGSEMMNYLLIDGEIFAEDRISMQ